MTCYVIQTKDTVYTTRNSVSTRPCVIAFRRYRNALQLIEFLSNTNNKIHTNRPRIEEIPEKLLKSKCYKTCLDVYMYEDASLFKSIEKPDQDYIMSLQRALRL